MQTKRGSPKILWGFVGCLVAGIRQQIASNIPSTMGRTSFKVVHGYALDITHYILHEWYGFVWWYDMEDKAEKVGRYLGPTGRQFCGGNCHFIIYKTGKAHVTNSTWPIKDEK